MCRLLPRSRGLPRFPGGSASASSLSRPSQASRALRPAGLLNRPRRPLSRGSSPVSCPTKPLVSYRSNRQLSGWNPPPLVIRAVGAHWGIRVEWIARSILGQTPLVRYGRQPRRLLVYGAQEPLAPSSIGFVDLLGLGSQFVAFGRHPSGVVYGWPVESPAETCLKELPCASPAQVEHFIGAV